VIRGSLEKSGVGNEKFLQPSENESTVYKNLWDTAKVVLRGKFRAMNAYI
jgi:hypothetical protein